MARVLVILGLGSNVGDRVRMLSRALHLLLHKKIIERPIRISSTYETPALLPAGAPDSWNQNFFNIVVEAKTKFSPEQLLKEVKSVEATLGRKQSERWAPREIDIDILFGEKDFRSKLLTLPHPEALKREFVLRPLAELKPEWAHLLEQFSKPEAQKVPVQILPTELMGILNLTPDSFSDGGKFSSIESAIKQAEILIQEGASILDLGAESTRPGANLLDQEGEWQRLKDILPRISELRRKNYPYIRLSLDSRYPETQRRALEYGIDILNDVSGRDVASVAQQSSKDYIFMHNLGLPSDRAVNIPDDQDVVAVLKSWAQEKSESFGIPADRLYFDPGIGFGKTFLQSFEILRRFEEFSELNLPLALGYSRKGFLNLLSSKKAEDRDPETALVTASLKALPAILRVHSVDQNLAALRAGLLLFA